ncbi:serine/threonine protein kinase [Actinoplanes sp. L3-i22]|uniref:serine/threonine protein kinase n=1 Tax=Actinoplanes sp. L3-i22 TaxID=2836373 RepID=UPI001C74FBBC|nr:serine/threonine protein kinase [Actinoplanes sp. L3-i22]BCY06708.1 hypothetical protein L3i22_017960 [Actinoplanes sp. L3-i22]
MLIAERYRLVGPLGQGGMGRVWAARDELLGRDVAIKELVPPAGLTEAELRSLRERSIREARSIARVEQANVVRVFDVVFDSGEPWIVMELVPSRSLYDVIQADGPMAPERVARIGLGVLAALRAAHRVGLLHRDVKPGNVLLAHDGRVVLTDFGLASAAGDSSMTSTGVVLGSPSYLAPERALDQDLTAAADLWSLGATLYAAVEGRPPYAKSSPLATLAALATELPAPPERAGVLRPALVGLLQRDPAQRADGETAHRLLLDAAAGGRPGQFARQFSERTFAGPTERMPAIAVPQAAVTRTTANPPPESEPARSEPAGSEAAGSGQAGGQAPDLPGPTVRPEPAEKPAARPRWRRRSLIAAVIVLVATGAGVGVLLVDGGGESSAQEPGATWIGSEPAVDDLAATPTGAVPSRAGAPSGRPAAKPTQPGRSPGGTVTVTVTAPGGAAPTATGTTAASAPGRRIQSHGTGTCLYAPATTGKVQLWSCADTDPFRFDFPSDGTMRVRGKCAQIDSTADGTQVHLATCTGGTKQQFNYNAASDLTSGWADKCVDVPDSSAANGVVAQIWECTGAENQKWTY